uniref:Uncharacterized protein n=1 Tax=Glossina brevipalpis TaxID=37001 RepID=A0A1A9WZ49_9MUSC
MMFFNFNIEFNGNTFVPNGVLCLFSTLEESDTVSVHYINSNNKIDEMRHEKKCIIEGLSFIIYLLWSIAMLMSFIELLTLDVVSNLNPFEFLEIFDCLTLGLENYDEECTQRFFHILIVPFFNNQSNRTLDTLCTILLPSFKILALYYKNKIKYKCIFRRHKVVSLPTNRALKVEKSASENELERIHKNLLTEAYQLGEIIPYIGDIPSTIQPELVQRGQGIIFLTPTYGDTFVLKEATIGCGEKCHKGVQFLKAIKDCIETRDLTLITLNDFLILELLKFFHHHSTNRADKKHLPNSTNSLP